MSGSAATENPYTRRMAEFISGLRYESIPPEVITRIKLLILDALGCGIYGAGLEWSRILQRSLAELDTSSGSVVWGTTQKLSGPHAALVNGSQVQGFEIDDIHHVGMLHSGATVLPALVALAESHPGMSGREFLTAAVAGYEIGPRVGVCMGTQFVKQGWQSGGNFGTFAAAAAAARGLKLDADKTVHALGIAGTQASGLGAVQYGSMVKRMLAGRASQNGLYGAQFAAAGYTGIVNVFESEYGGFCTTFTRSTDRFNLDGLTGGLGSEWLSMLVRLKLYSSNGSIHPTLDAIRDMRAQRPFGPGDIERIVVHTSDMSVEHVGGKYVPTGATSAQYSLTYCVATLLLDGEVFVDQFAEDKLIDPARIALADKISVLHDPEISAKGPKYRQMARVEVYLKDGTRLEHTRETSNQKTQIASEAEVVSKFENLATHALARPQAEQLRDAMLNVEKVADAAQIARLMAKG